MPLKKGRAATMTQDYKDKGKGPTTLLAALNVLDGQIIARCEQRHRNLEWLKFLPQIERQALAAEQLYLIADNYSTQKHLTVHKWLAKRPSIHMHFTPASVSSLNMVEGFPNRLAGHKTPAYILWSSVSMFS